MHIRRRQRLNAEYRSQGGLAQSYHNLLAQLLHTVSQTYGSGGLTLSGGGGVDGRHQDQLAVLLVGLSQQVVVNFCFVLAVLLQVLVIDACLCSDLGDRLHFALLWDLNVSFESHCKDLLSH